MLGPQMVACSTPGSARNRSSRRSPPRALASGVSYRPCGSSSRTVSSRSDRNARSVLVNCERLCNITSAPAASTKAAVTSTPASQRAVLDERATRPAPAAITARALVREARHIGAKPNSSPHSNAVAIVTARTTPSIRTCAKAGSDTPLIRTSAGVIQDASTNPPAAPAAANVRLSTTSWRTRREAEAPTASRIANSRDRSADRTSRRLATLTQPISRTNTDPPSRNHNGRRASTKYWLDNSAGRSEKFLFVAGFASAMCAPNAASSALADSMVAPSARRARPHVKRLLRSVRLIRPKSAGTRSIGAQTSTRSPVLSGRSLNDSGITPITVKTRSCNRMSRPTIAGSAPNSWRHVASLRTATSVSSATAWSSEVKVRPSSGVAPRIAK